MEILVILVEAFIAVLPGTSFFVSGLYWSSLSLRVSVSKLCGDGCLCFLSFYFSIREDSILWPLVILVHGLHLFV